MSGAEGTAGGPAVDSDVSKGTAVKSKGQTYLVRRAVALHCPKQAR